MDIYRVHVLCKSSLSLALTVIFVCCESFIDPSRFQYPRCWALSVTLGGPSGTATLDNAGRRRDGSAMHASRQPQLGNSAPGSGESQAERAESSGQRTD